MFIAIALMCVENDLRTCSMMVWNDLFETEEECVASNASVLGQLGPQGYIVDTACFKVDDLGEPV
jgi:hypothetical protein